MKALVTNCTRNSGLVVMRSLAEAGWTVLGADDRVPPLGLRSASAAGPYALLPEELSLRFTMALLDLLRRERPDVLIPTRGIEMACRIATDVRALTATLLPPLAAFEILNDKEQLLTLCDRIGFGTPLRLDPPEARAFLRTHAGARVVVKPRRDVGGGTDVCFLGSDDDIEAVYTRVARRPGGALITEWIPGEMQCQRALHLLFDANTRLIGHFVMRKTRVWPPMRGVSVAGVSVHEPHLLRAVLPIFEELRWQGPADVELKIDARDGVPRMLEINPRFSGAIGFAIGCGVDMAGLFCHAALGDTLPEQLAPRYPAGLRYVDLSRWVKAGIAQRRLPGNLRQLWQEIRGPRASGTLRLSDTGAWLSKLLLPWGKVGAHDDM